MTTARDVIAQEIGPGNKRPERALAALKTAGFVVVACPPGGRVVVSRESKPCEACDGTGDVQFAAPDDCLRCRGSGVVEATTIHGLEVEHWRWQDGAPVFRQVALPEGTPQ